MKKENKPNTTNRSKAMLWWMGLNIFDKISFAKTIREGAKPEHLTGREIEQIWRKETQVTYHNFWDSFDIRLYKKIVEVKRKKEDLKAHLKFFVI